MKTLIIAATILCFSVITYSQGVPDNFVYVDTDIRGRGCNGGSGICTMSSVGDESTANASMDFNIEENYVRFNFYLDKISVAEKNRLFNLCPEVIGSNRECLVLENDYIIKTDILQKISEGEYTSGYLLKGKYPLVQEGTNSFAYVNIMLYE